MRSRSTWWDQQSASITHPHLSISSSRHSPHWMFENNQIGDEGREITGRCSQDQPGEINNLLPSHTRTFASLPLDTHHTGCSRNEPDRWWRSEVIGRCSQDQPGEINKLLPPHIRTAASLLLDTHRSGSKWQLDRWWRSEITGWCG